MHSQQLLLSSSNPQLSQIRSNSSNQKLMPLSNNNLKITTMKAMETMTTPKTMLSQITITMKALVSSE